MDQRVELFRLEENVPPAYVETSRDMQMMLRLFTLALNACKKDGELIKYSNNAQLCSDRVISHLDGKLGFFPKNDYITQYMRVVAKVFGTLVRRKGTKDAIVQAVQLFFQAQNLQTSMYINITNKGEDDDQSYVIDIGIESYVRNVDLLEDILRYIIPTGYVYNIFFFEQIDALSKIHNSSKGVLYIYKHNGSSDLPSSYKFNDDETQWATDDLYSKNGSWTSYSMQNILVGRGETD